MRNYDEIPLIERFMVAVLLQSLMWWTNVANVVSTSRIATKLQPQFRTL